MRAVACFVNWFVYGFIEIPRNASRALAGAYAMPLMFAMAMNSNKYSETDVSHILSCTKGYGCLQNISVYNIARVRDSTTHLFHHPSQSHPRWKQHQKRRGRASYAPRVNVRQSRVRLSQTQASSLYRMQYSNRRSRSRIHSRQDSTHRNQAWSTCG
jgi:hypothetical protein